MGSPLPEGIPGLDPALALGALALGVLPIAWFSLSGWGVPLPKKQIPPKAALFSGGEARIAGGRGECKLSTQECRSWEMIFF